MKRVIDASVSFKCAVENLPIIFPSLSLLPRAYEISSQTRASVYDALYVTLSREFKASAIVIEKQLENAAIPLSCE